MSEDTAFSGFLASRMGAELDPIRALRKQIYELGIESGRPIWVAECSAHDDLERLSGPEIQARCLQQARTATDLICIIDGTYGTAWNDAELCVLELEIITATLTGGRFHFFKLAPYQPDVRTEHLMRAVLTARPDVANTEPQPPALILQALKGTLANLPRARVFTRRKRYSAGSLRLDTTFLDGDFAPLTTTPRSEDFISHLLRQSAIASDESTRLVYVWMAIRHLCAAPYTNERFKTYLPLWDAALSCWASASAWYGLHGHHYLGRLAAVNTMLRIRHRLADSSADTKASLSIQGTYGALASEFYSIAKIASSRNQRRELLNRALTAVNLAIEQEQTDESGLLGIRGSILQASGRLRAGLQDYGRMLDLRIRAGEDEGRLGEAQAELGMGNLRVGRIWLAGRLLREGVQRLERSGRKKFLVRALRKQALFYVATLRPWRGLATLERAYTIAADGEMRGQISQIKPTLRILRRFLLIRPMS